MSDNDPVHILKITATIFSLIPIIIGLIKYNTLNSYFRSYIYFLSYGFIVDVSIWFTSGTDNPMGYFFYNSFSLVESVYLFWFISMTTSSSWVKKITWKPSLLLIPFWIIAHYFINTPEKFSSIFDTTYLIAISLLSGYVILKHIEKDFKDYETSFWILIGIFIYAFTTFFISSLLETEMIQKLWFLQNSINILVYSIFAKAFWVSKPVKLTY